MASKRFKNKTCVYCAKPNSSTEGDHVIAREFFLIKDRGDLPQVAACKKCNNEKSKLEHYLATVLPLGGRHGEADVVRETLVPSRMNKNLKLKKQLFENPRYSISPATGEPLGVLLPVHGEKIADLFKYILKGLIYHHWQMYVPEDKYFVTAGYLNEQGVIAFEERMRLLKQHSICGNFGNDTFVYEGAKLIEDASIWRMSLYGVIVGTRGLTQSSTHIYGTVSLYGL
jgi:hypothetical protein